MKWLETDTDALGDGVFAKASFDFLDNFELYLYLSAFRPQTRISFGNRWYLQTKDFSINVIANETVSDYY